MSGSEKGRKYLLVDGEKGYKYSTTICATLFGNNLWAVCVFVVQIHTQLINWYQIMLHKMVPSNSSTKPGAKYSCKRYHMPADGQINLLTKPGRLRTNANSSLNGGK